MSEKSLEQLLADDLAKFRREVFVYLAATDRAKSGRTYFGLQAANNPALVGRLEADRGVELKTITRVRRYMLKHPPETYRKYGKSCGVT